MQKDNRTALMLAFVGYAFLILAAFTFFLAFRDDIVNAILTAGLALTMGLILLGLKEIINILERNAGTK